MAIGIEIARLAHVGATPQITLCLRISGLNTSTNPRITSRIWVAKSTTAREIESFAASVTPTTLSETRITITIAPATMSHGLVFNGSQKTDR